MLTAFSAAKQGLGDGRGGRFAWVVVVAVEKTIHHTDPACRQAFRRAVLRSAAFWINAWRARDGVVGSCMSGVRSRAWRWTASSSIFLNRLAHFGRFFSCFGSSEPSRSGQHGASRGPVASLTATLRKSQIASVQVAACEVKTESVYTIVGLLNDLHKQVITCISNLSAWVKSVMPSMSLCIRTL